MMPSAADIERDDVLDRRELRRPDGAEHAADRAGEQQVDRLFLCCLRRCHAAERLHQVDIRRIALVAQRLLERADIARGRRADVRVEARRREALVLAELRQDLATEGEVDLRVFFLDDFPDAFFMRRIQEGEQEADRDGLDLLRLHLAHGLTDFVLVKRDQLPAVRRDHALCHAVAVLTLADRILC